jgi:DNA-binding NtrC family response regulator
VGEPGRALRVDVRVVAATNRDLEEAVRTGSFRKDLYYRLAVVPIDLPPLRERRQDLAPLVRTFLAVLAPDREVQVEPDAWSLLERYEWPGNVRELRNALEHALVIGGGDAVRSEDLPAALQDADPLDPRDQGGATLLEIERRCLAQALLRTSFNRTHAARLLGITRRTLGYRLRKYGLEDELAVLRASRADAPAEPLRVTPPAVLREVC